MTAGHAPTRFGLTVILLTFAGAASALAAGCSEATSLVLPDTKITKAKLVAAGAFKPPASPFPLPPGLAPAPYRAMLAFCRIDATLTPTPDSDIRIEVWMPAANWNGKFVGAETTLRQSILPLEPRAVDRNAMN